MTHKGSIIIKTDRLILRPFTLNDDKAMFNNWANDERVTRFVTWHTHNKIDYTRILLKEWVRLYKNQNRYHWAIEVHSKVIGSIGVEAIDEVNESAELGYCLSADFWNKGIVTECCKVVIDYLFNEVGFHRLSACHMLENIASGRVMQKCGMKFEGTHRDKIKLSKGKFVDVSTYSILSHEWNKER